MDRHNFRSGTLQAFRVGQFALAFAKGPKTLRLQLQRRSHVEGIQGANAEPGRMPLRELDIIASLDPGGQKRAAAGQTDSQKQMAQLIAVPLCEAYFAATGLGPASFTSRGASNCSKFLAKRVERSAAIVS